MPNSTFEFAGHRFTVREAIGGDVLIGNLVFADLAERIAKDMDITTDEMHTGYILAAEWYTGMLFRTTIEALEDGNELPFTWVHPAKSTAEQIFESYQSVVNGSAVLVRLWRKASRESNLEQPNPEE